MSDLPTVHIEQQSVHPGDLPVRMPGVAWNPGTLILLCALIPVVGLAGGCGGSAAAAARAERDRARDVERERAKQINPQLVQSQTMAFASRYMIATADVYSDIQLNAATPEAQLAALRRKTVSAYGAIGCAVEFNPLVGLVDMAVMVRLNRGIAEGPWDSELFGPDNAARILSMLRMQETTVWTLIDRYLTVAQIVELREICDWWMREHPGRQYVIGVGLADFQKAAQEKTKNPTPPGSIFALLGLDPFSQLDPAVKQVEQSRVLAERMAFEVRHMPMFLSWQADSLYLQVLATPQAKELLASVSGFSKLSETIDGFVQQLPDQQDALIQQLNDSVTEQREAALNQATTQISLQREEAIKQIGDAVTAQREEALKDAMAQVSIQRDETIKQIDSMLGAQQKSMAGNLQVALDNSIDRLFRRALLLLLIIAGSAGVALMIYRVRARRGSRRNAA